MIECPKCGVEQETKNKHCSNCQHTFRYEDLADYDPEDIAFTIEFKCMNCDRTFKRGFAKGDKVEPAGARRNKNVINPVTGNRYEAWIDDYPCILQCPTCDNDTSLYVTGKNPLRER